MNFIPGLESSGADRDAVAQGASAGLARAMRPSGPSGSGVSRTFSLG